MNVVFNDPLTFKNYIKVYNRASDVKKACQADLPPLGFDPELWCSDASNIFAGYLLSPFDPNLYYSFFWRWCPTGADYDPVSASCKPVQIQNFTLKPCQTCTSIGDAPKADFGDPIQPLTGSISQVVSTGLLIGGVALTFHYNSVRQLIAAADGRDLMSWRDVPSLGPLWSTNLHRGLVIGNGDVQAYRGAGAIVSFTLTDGVYVPGADVRDRLVIDGSGYKYTDAASGATETYDGAGKLLTLSPIGGGQLTFSHSTAATPIGIAPAPGYLIGIQDHFGRTLSFTYALPTGGDASTDGKLSALNDGEGRVVTPAYDAVANLSMLTWQDGTTNLFLYENTAFPSALTGILNSSGTRRVTFAYDAGGRATSTTMAGGTLRYAVAYATPPAVVLTKVYDPNQNLLLRTESWTAPTGTVVTGPNGTVSSLSSSVLKGSTVLTSTSQAAGAGSPASNSTVVYNAQAKQVQRDDFRGVRWCAAYDDARNLPVVTVEGLGNATACAAVTPAAATLPAGSRKTSTSWHPSWSLPVQVAEPLRLITRVYNGQPDPFNSGAIASCVTPADLSLVVECKRVEQATLDADGHLGASAALDTTVPARTWRTTFNAQGQVLTSKGPRTDLDDTTTFAYFTDTVFSGVNPSAVGHTVGDLNTVTDALGRVTTFATYTKNGLPLQSADANAVNTVVGYDAKGRVTSVGVGGQVTAYTYDLNGQLQKITLPDGVSTVTFEYDAALRQTAVFDNRGNRIESGLDNFGNWTAAAVKDPAGTLARSLARAMDDLGRIQSLTGRE